MTAPDQSPDSDLEIQELTDENLEEVSGGAVAMTPVRARAITDAVLADGGSGRGISLS